jgi:hypothetical protein
VTFSGSLITGGDYRSGAIRSRSYDDSLSHHGFWPYVADRPGPGGPNGGI